MTYQRVAKTLTSSDGTPVYAEAVGDPSKPSVVLAHGIYSSAAIFDNVFSDERLLAEVYLIRYDLRGHGRSGKPENPEAYVSSLFAADYAAVAREFGVKQPIWFGWSYGATIACDVYTHLPTETFSAIVWVAGVPYVGPVFNKVARQEARGYLPGHMNTSDVVLYRQSKVDFGDLIFHDPDGMDFNLKMSSLGQAFLLSPQVTQNLLTRTHDPTKLYEAGEKGLPLLAMSGSKDKLVDGSIVVAEAKSHFQNMDVYTVEGGSHTPWIEHKDEIVTELLKFVRKVTKPAM